MNNIYVSQDNSVLKRVDENLIEFLYNISKSQSEQTTQYMKGRLEVPHGFQDAINFLTGKFSDLYINSLEGPYLRFEDSVVNQKLAERIGDGVGVTVQQAQSLSSSSVLKPLFADKSDVTTFNELKSFTGISSLMHECFVRCTNLKSIDISNITIFEGRNTFSDCTNLKYVIGTENLLEINGDGHFHSCDLIGDYDFSGIINSNHNVLNFSNNKHLTSLKLSPYITNIPNIYGCTSFESFINCEGITEITHEALRSSSIKTLNCPNCTTISGNNNCYSCTSLETVSLPSLTTCEGGSTFNECTSLVSVNLGINLTKLNDWMFFGCSSLTTLSCPNVTKLKKSALYNTPSLTNIDFDWSNIDELGEYALNNCGATNTNEVISFDSYTSLTVNAFNGSKFKYLKFPVLEQFDQTFAYISNLETIELNENITVLPSYVFTNDTKLRTVSKVHNVETINDYAFQWCSGLETLDCSSNKLKTIGTYAFRNCSKLVSIVGDNILQPTSLDQRAFDGCSTFDKPIDLSQCSDLPKGLFCNCRSITSISGLSNFTEIKEETFYNCVKLPSLDFSSNLKIIGDAAFRYDTLLTTISNETIYPTSIGFAAFDSCNAFIGPIDISQCTSLGDRVFYYCSSLTSIGTLNSSLTKIPDSCFSNCKALTGNIDIPESVTELCGSCFYGCESLTSITFHSLTPPTYGPASLIGANYQIRVPNAAVEAYKTAWPWDEITSRIVGY